MKSRFKLKDSLKQFASSMRRGLSVFREIVSANGEIACRAALLEAQRRTPHKGDGKKRGENMISNALQKAWRVDWNLVNKNNKSRIYAEVIITNEKTYAPFVQYGHKMTPHFVPWLYKDGQGTISRATGKGQAPFGLVMGNRTPFVAGIDMIGPAIDVFNNVFDKLNRESLNKPFKQ